MTKTTRILMLSVAMILTGLWFSSCAETDDGSYVPPITLGEKIAGEWLLSSVNQIDETNSKTMDLTSQLNFGSFGINLSEGGNFTVTGTAPALLPTSGTWRMANNYLNSNGTAAEIILNDKVFLTVTGVPTGGTSHLKYKFTRKSNGIAFVSYEYDLIKANINNEPTE